MSGGRALKSALLAASFTLDVGACGTGTLLAAGEHVGTCSTDGPFIALPDAFLSLGMFPPILGVE